LQLRAASITERLRALADDSSEEAIAATGAMYAARHEREPYTGIAVTRDLAYGPHERQRLDLFVGGPPVAEPRPVFVFAHGGGYVSGGKRLAGTPYYDNVALWAVRRQNVGITMNYRFAPEHAWPSGADDVAGVVDWIAANAPLHGGDPTRIVLMGHSAGAAHMASYLARTPGSPIAAAIFASGVYDLTVMERSPRHAAHFGDASLAAERSSLPGVAASRVPLLVLSAEWEPRKFHPQAAALLAAVVERRGGMPPAACLAGETHFSPVFQLNADEGVCSGILETFLAGCRESVVER
jgi:acetyl esterase/lipase